MDTNLVKVTDVIIALGGQTIRIKSLQLPRFNMRKSNKIIRSAIVKSGHAVSYPVYMTYSVQLQDGSIRRNTIRFLQKVLD
jgi:hypothetical protein